MTSFSLFNHPSGERNPHPTGVGTGNALPPKADPWGNRLKSVIPRGGQGNNPDQIGITPVLCLLLFLLGLAPYLYLPWAALRNPPLNWGDPVNLQDFFRLVTRADYGSLTLFSGSGELDRLEVFVVHARSFLKDIFLGFSPLGLPLIFVSLFIIAFRLKKTLCCFFLVVIAFSGPLFVLVNNLPLSSAFLLATEKRFFLISFTVLASLLPLAIFSFLGNIHPRIVLASLLLPALLLFLNFRRSSLREYRQFENFGGDLLKTLPRNSLLLSAGDPFIYSLYYLRFVEKKRPDIIALGLNDLRHDWFYRALRRRGEGSFIPFKDPAKEPFIVRSIIDRYIKERPVFMVFLGDNAPYGFYEKYQLVQQGFLRRIIPKEEAISQELFSNSNRDLLENYSPYENIPDLPFDGETFEYSLAEIYAGAHFDLAAAFYTTYKDEKTAVLKYRWVIEYLGKKSVPSRVLSLSYKNLGAIYGQQYGDLKKQAELWRKSLDVDPYQKEAVEMREFVRARF